MKSPMKTLGEADMPEKNEWFSVSNDHKLAWITKPRLA